MPYVNKATLSNYSCSADPKFAHHIGAVSSRAVVPGGDYPDPFLTVQKNLDTDPIREKTGCGSKPRKKFIIFFLRISQKFEIVFQTKKNLFTIFLMYIRKVFVICSFSIIFGCIRTINETVYPHN